MSLKSAALVGRLSTTRQPGGLFVKTDCGPHSHVLPRSFLSWHILTVQMELNCASKAAAQVYTADDFKGHR